MYDLSPEEELALSSIPLEAENFEHEGRQGDEVFSIMTTLETLRHCRNVLISRKGEAISEAPPHALHRMTMSYLDRRA